VPANSVHEVSFDYHINLNPANDLDTSAPGYFSFCVTDAEGRRTDEIRWYDKAWQGDARKTAIVHTADRPPYHMQWRSVGGGALTISNVHVDTIAPDRARIVNVNSDDVILGNARVEEQVRVHADRDRS